MTNTRNMTREERKTYYIKQNIIIWLKLLAAVSLLIMSIVTIKNVVKYPEEYFTTIKYQLMLDINEHEQDAIDRYQDKYISRDKYLFNGPVTIEMCCEKYGYDFNKTVENFQESGYDTFQTYFDKVLSK